MMTWPIALNFLAHMKSVGCTVWGERCKGVLYLTLPESMYDSAQKRTENGTYPIYLRDAELLLRDALTNTRYESKVYLDLTDELKP